MGKSLQDRWALGFATDCFPERPAAVEWLHPPKGRFYADPFLFGGWCFFEEWVGGKGRISACSLTEKSATIPVLELDTHLSYPFVFEHEGEIYMLPEQSPSTGLTLYRCRKFPDRWEARATLLDLGDVVDATPHHDGRHWYLFLGIGKGAKHELQIWTSPGLQGPYRHHSTHTRPMLMRSAGALFRDRDGRLIRPAQNREVTYGGSLLFYEVLELTNRRYEERELARWHPDASWPYPDGLHHLSSAYGTLVIDAKRIVEDLND